METGESHAQPVQKAACYADGEIEEFTGVGWEEGMRSKALGISRQWNYFVIVDTRNPTLKYANLVI